MKTASRDSTFLLESFDITKPSHPEGRASATADRPVRNFSPVPNAHAATCTPVLLPLLRRAIILVAYPMKSASTLNKPRLGSRRSQRLKLQVPVAVARQHAHHGSAREDAITLNVNAFGGMFALKGPVQRGEVLILINKSTREQQECRVVYIGPSAPNGKKIGVEFTQPAENFWRINFPGVDSTPNYR